MRKIAKVITELDREALGSIAKCGFIGVDNTGEPFLETNIQVRRYRLSRLIALELVIPSNDALFGGTQTYYTVTT